MNNPPAFIRPTPNLVFDLNFVASVRFIPKATLASDNGMDEIEITLKNSQVLKFAGEEATNLWNLFQDSALPMYTEKK